MDDEQRGAIGDSATARRRDPSSSTHDHSGIVSIITANSIIANDEQRIANPAPRVPPFHTRRVADSSVTAMSRERGGDDRAIAVTEHSVPTRRALDESVARALLCGARRSFA